MAIINCFDISKIDKDLYNIFYISCSKERQKRADKFRFQEDSIRCVISEMLLQYSIYQAQGRISNTVIRYNSFGKPFLNNSDNFHYNISHSGKWVVLAYSDAEVGIDIEKIRFSHENIMQNYFTKEELRFIASGKDKTEQSKRFTQVWTLKESYMKYQGTGLFTDLKSFSVINADNKINHYVRANHNYPQLHSWLFDETYYLSLCCEEDFSEISEISLEQLLKSGSPNERTSTLHY